MLLLEVVVVGCIVGVVEEVTPSVLIGGGFRLMVPSFVLLDVTPADEVAGGILLL